MEVVVEAVALVVWIQDPECAIAGRGWYVLDAEVPEAGKTGPFPTKAAATAHARRCGYTEVR